jgi:hypothetical protein
MANTPRRMRWAYNTKRDKEKCIHNCSAKIWKRRGYSKGLDVSGGIILKCTIINSYLWGALDSSTLGQTQMADPSEHY